MSTQQIDIPIFTYLPLDWDSTCLELFVRTLFILLPVPTLYNVGRLEQEEITEDNLKTILEREHRQVAFYEYLKQRFHFQAKGLGLL